MILPWGKHKGRDTSAVPLKYQMWILRARWVSADIKHAVRVDIDAKRASEGKGPLTGSKRVAGARKLKAKRVKAAHKAKEQKPRKPKAAKRITQNRAQTDVLPARPPRLVRQNGRFKDKRQPRPAITRASARSSAFSEKVEDADSLTEAFLMM